MNKIITILFISFLTPIIHASIPSPGKNPEALWERIKNKRGVEVFKKEIPGQKVVAFRGEMVIDGSVEKIFHILLDNSKRKEWADRLEESVVLEQKSPHEYVLYQNFFLPWPLKNREFVYKGNAYIERKNNNVVLHMESIDDHPNLPTDRKTAVRAELKNSYYYLSKLGENQTRLVVEIHSDPKGHIPSWVVNLVQSSWPVKTLNGIKDQLKSLDPEKEYKLPDLPISTTL